MSDSILLEGGGFLLNSTGGHILSAGAGLSIAGPATTPVGVASSNYTVTGFALPGNTVVTLSDDGAGGTFSPATMTLTIAQPSGTFTYTPATAGAITLATSSDQADVDDGSIAITAQAATYAISGPTSAANNTLAGPWTLQVAGTLPSNVTVQLSDQGLGGTFKAANGITTVTSVVLPAGTNGSVTFKYLPATVGLVRFDLDSSGALSDPGLYTVTVASQVVTLTGPNSGFQNQPLDYTISVAGTLTNAVTFTPDDGGHHGEFVPASITIPSGANRNAQFRYTPAEAGTIPLSLENDGNLDDPATLAVTIAVAEQPIQANLSNDSLAALGIAPHLIVPLKRGGGALLQDWLIDPGSSFWLLLDATELADGRTMVGLQYWGWDDIGGPLGWKTGTGTLVPRWDPATNRLLIFCYCDPAFRQNPAFKTPLKAGLVVRPMFAPAFANDNDVVQTEEATAFTMQGQR